MTLTFREMRVEDIAATSKVRFSTIENAITAEELERIYSLTPETLAAAMQADVKGWLCEEAGNVIGFAMGNRSNGEVLVLAVRPEVEGRGIGQTLLRQVQDWLFSVGYDEIWLASNSDPAVRAFGFYRNLGWTRAGPHERGEEILKLRKL